MTMKRRVFAEQENQNSESVHSFHEVPLYSHRCYCLVFALCIVDLNFTVRMQSAEPSTG